MTKRTRRDGRGRPTIRDLLEEAAFHHRAARHAEAEAICRRILQSRPDQPHALHLLGVAIHQGRRDPRAADVLRRAIEIAPDFAEAHGALGRVLHELGRLDEAVAVHRRSVRLAPESPGAHEGLAAALLARGDVEPALTAYTRALELAPESVALAGELAAALRRMGRSADALEAARDCARRLPESAEAHGLLAMELHREGKLEESLVSHEAAVGLAPDSPVALTNRGVTEQALGDMEAAEASHRAATTTDPSSARAQHNHALVLMELGRLESATAAFERVLALEPSDADAHWNYSLCLLRSGRLREGWNEFEWRWRAPGSGCVERHADQPYWDGSALGGRRLLVHAEQGLGDTIQFARYLPLLARRGERILFECPPELHRLMSTLDGRPEIVRRGDAVEFDVHLPLLSLPRFFGTTLRSIPAAGVVSPLDADRERWARELPSGREPLVGFVWAGSPTHRNDAQRSIPIYLLDALMRKLRKPGIRCFSLQVGGGETPPGITDLGPRLRDFAETAAVIANLDLVITVDTAAAHLAGVLGAPVWVLVPFAPDWRWMDDRDDSPWYPTMRLFRQEKRGDWGEVIDRINASLGQVVAT